MLKHLTAALLAASLLGAPLLATNADAAQPAAKTTLTTKPVAKVVTHKRYALHHRKHVKHVRHWRAHKKHYAHVRHWKWVKVHGKFVRVVVKTPATAMIRKPAKVMIKKPVVLKQAPAKTTAAK
jgi:hypothetical protein